MAETKFGSLIKPFSFSDDGIGSYRQCTKMDGEFFGYDLCLQYGAFWTAGKVGKAPFDAEAHDFDEVMIFMGTNTYDPGYLGAEVELLIGEDRNKQMITTSTSVAIPKGLPHLPLNIERLENRFILMTISITNAIKASQVHIDKAPTWSWGLNTPYKDNVKHLAFERNGPWHYGPRNPDTHAGAITEINGKDFDFNMSYETINKAPYRFGPIPDKPHVHPYTEFLLFMGTDTNDLSNLGAEVEMYMGKEMEKHVITKPCVAIQPKGHPHCPLIVNKQDRSWIFAVVRPWGHSGEGQNGYLP